MNQVTIRLQQSEGLSDFVPLRPSSGIDAVEEGVPVICRSACDEQMRIGKSTGPEGTNDVPRIDVATHSRSSRHDL